MHIYETGNQINFQICGLQSVAIGCVRLALFALRTVVAIYCNLKYNSVTQSDQLNVKILNN